MQAWLFRQKGLIFFVFFLIFELFIVGLHLLDFAPRVCENCYLSMYLFGKFLMYLAWVLWSWFISLTSRAWGFLCPVHTPDGEPCGLLNHMASTCRKCTSFWLSYLYSVDFLSGKAERWWNVDKPFKMSVIICWECFICKPQTWKIDSLAPQ